MSPNTAPSSSPLHTTPPVAPRRPVRLEAYGDVRVDDWHWLRDRDDPAVIAYLEAENDYTEAVTAASAGLRERLYEQIKDRVQEDDLSAPSRYGGWWYWSRTTEGSQYRIHCRLADPQRGLDAATALANAADGAGVVILDENVLAEGHEFFHLGVYALSHDQRWLAYGVDHDGSERYALRFRDLASGNDLPDAVDDASYTAAWAADGETLFYTRQDEAMRPHEVWIHRLGRPAEEDERVFHEPDERFFVSVGLTRSRRFVLIAIESKQTSEVRFIPASDPTA
jgi:oligopeptidase B